MRLFLMMALIGHVLCQSSNELHFQELSLADALATLRLTTFLQYIKKIGLETTLRQSGPYTLFVPLDEAFLTTPIDDLKELLRDENSTWHFVTYHISSGIIELSDRLENGQVVRTVLGARAIANKRYDPVQRVIRYWFQGAPVLKANIFCRNGIIHIIGSLLRRPTRSMTEILNTSEDFRMFRSVIDSSGLLVPRATTLVVPIDHAFQQLPKQWLQGLHDSRYKSQDLVLYHTLTEMDCPDCIFSTSGMTSQDTLLGQSLTTYRDPFARGSVFINNAAIYRTYAATDGWIIAVTEVLLGRDTAANVLSVIKQTSTSEFYQLVYDSSYGSVLRKPWLTFTLFAPSNEAMKRLTIEQRKELRNNASLRDRVVAFHVVTERVVLGTTSLFGRHNTMLNGKRQERKAKLRSNTLDEVSIIEGARVVQSDGLAKNGIVHVIDRVLFPPEKNLVEIIETDSRLKLFRMALDKTRLVYSLRTSEMFTLIVPSDWAMIEHLRRKNKEFRSNKYALHKFVRCHIISEAFFVRTLHEGQSIKLKTVIRGHKASIRRNTDTKELSARFNGKARSLALDIRASNGVVHIIDDVLL